MSETRSGYILRKHLSDQIRYAIEDAAKQPVNQAADNQAYEIGKALGYTEGLKHAQQLLANLYDEPKPEPRGPWHHAKRG